MDTIEEDAFYKTKAWHVVNNLIILIGLGVLADNYLHPPYQGFWSSMAFPAYLACVGYAFVVKKEEIKRHERAIVEENSEARQSDYERKLSELKQEQSETEQVQAFMEHKANELKAEASAIKAKATALESIANDNATLGEERRTLTSQVHSLGEQLANADKEKQTLMQLHDKETQTLLTKLSIAEKEAVSLRKKLADIEREEEERSFKKSVKATWSSSSKNESTMNEKFGQGNWEEYVNK